MIRLTLIAAVFAAVCNCFVVSALARDDSMKLFGSDGSLRWDRDDQDVGPPKKTLPEQNKEKTMDGQQEKIRSIAQTSDFPPPGSRRRSLGRIPPAPNKEKTMDGQQEKIRSDGQKSDFPPPGSRRRSLGRKPSDPHPANPSK